MSMTVNNFWNDHEAGAVYGGNFLKIGGRILGGARPEDVVFVVGNAGVF